MKKYNLSEKELLRLEELRKNLTKNFLVREYVQNRKSLGFIANEFGLNRKEKKNIKNCSRNF